MSAFINQPLPLAVLKKMDKDGMKDVPTTDYFKGKKAVVVGVPGAFTPLCSSKHIPEFAKAAKAIKEKGYDEIICVAVNDAYVMQAWGRDLKADKDITFLADADAQLTKALGLELDARAHGLGTRCQRFVMLVDNGVITALNVEDSPGKCSVSSAATVLAALENKL